MKLRVLGCSGGIGGESRRTTALLVDHDVLIDAGTGVVDLTIPDMALIDHVFLTHCHLDHIAALPLLVDTVADRRQTPLTVYGTAPVLALLRRHIFNWEIWPDLSQLPSAEQPFLRYQAIEPGVPVSLGARSFTALPVDHHVPAVGYRLDSGRASLVFSGDTGPCDAFWQAVNAVDNLRHLIIECAFPNRDERLATLSRHLCPSLLAAELRKLERCCAIHIAHLKPGQSALTMAEIAPCLDDFKPQMLTTNQVFEF
ncbi:MAG: 3',5'-cyclic-nucleotide phosphodiesterase [Azonexus sp.]|jgi:ribonuclease BN (tRNA processing enzyme)|uniref:3',5'-cyclic-nucleotide phosphodiesterase n=1 Tax=Azonexus sp. TaxID=1872668 RepID=UPI002827F4B8|nr:3',5'-cyclic-nucleotide phosphodiesterase [Azonexus sp.]MDR0775729.1 3',5'-cyclic-nucleotide phosphodiesterase [Azonexus sp.]